MGRWFMVILLCIPYLSHSQIRDRNWIIGHWGHLITFAGDGSYFRQAMRVQPLPIFGEGSSCISDENGEVALICNGYFLYDTIGNVIENGDSLVPDKLVTKDFGFSTWPQQSIVLPKSGNQYYVFTAAMSDSAFDDWDNAIRFNFDMLTYHVVEAYGGGKGSVLEKGNILIKDAVLSHNRMTAVKHANGRDWWLIKPHQKEHIFYKFLVTPNTIMGPFEQKINKPTIEFPGNPKLASISGSSSFTRNGQFYAHTVAGLGGVFVNRFDRCNGTFTEYAYYDIPQSPDTNHVGDFTYGVAFSPNSKLLYAITAYNIWQMDLQDTTNSSVQFVHGPDTNVLNQFQRYLYPSLAPDGKIYIGNFNKVIETMSYIEYPNKRGADCSFCARCLRSDYLSNPPNMPYYALGAVEGSPCDTIGKLQAESIKLYPNPASSELKIYLPVGYNKPVQLRLYNTVGQRLLITEKILDARQEFTTDLSSVAKGIYLLQIESDGQRWQEKIVIE